MIELKISSVTIEFLQLPESGTLTGIPDGYYGDCVKGDDLKMVNCEQLKDMLEESLHKDFIFIRVK